MGEEANEEMRNPEMRVDQYWNRGTYDKKAERDTRSEQKVRTDSEGVRIL